MLNRLLEGKLGVSAMDAIPLLREARRASDEIAAAYEARNFAVVTRTICAIADKANKYVEDQAPWKLVKTDPDGARGVLTAALEVGRILTIYLKPILPEFAAKVEHCLAVRPQNWDNIQEAMEPHTIHAFEHLVQRLETKAVDAMVEESKESAQKSEVSSQKPEGGAAAGGAAAEGFEPVAATITIDQFAAVDLRVAKVLTAEPLEKSDKLIKLTLDAGPIGTRTILAGIKKAYTPERLVGRLVIFCANLAPRAMGKGGSLGTSEGMICAASSLNGPANEVFVLSPDSGAKPGQRVH
jgi:methionyl-tRNA synthetase